MLSVVIPTLNEEKQGYLPRILQRLTEISGIEVICVDGGSRDDTLTIIQDFPTRLLKTEANTRAERLNRGIEIARNSLILLHHPRSLIEREGIEYLIQNSSSLKWGGFTHAFDSQHPFLAFTSWYSNSVRFPYEKIIYLDHGIFFQKPLLSRPIPTVDIFEDTEVSKILRESGPPTLLPFHSVTSSVRFQKNGFARQGLLNLTLKAGYHLKIPKKWMNRIYERRLNLNSEYRSKSENPQTPSQAYRNTGRSRGGTGSSDPPSDHSS